jgi:type II secretory pathway pseudopilin PulG
MRRSPKAKHQAFTLVEVMVAAGLLALSTVLMTQSMLVLNRNSSIARVRNLAKAKVLEKIQEATVVKYAPNTDDKTEPPPLKLTSGEVLENIELGDATAGIGKLPAKRYYSVKAAGTLSGDKAVQDDKDVKSVRVVTCRIEYTYLGKTRTYEAVTYRSPD